VVFFCRSFDSGSYSKIKIKLKTFKERKRMSINERIDWALWQLCKTDFQGDYNAWLRYVETHPDMMKSLRRGYTDQHGVPSVAPSKQEIVDLLTFRR
jgi:hypothetical protein